MPSATLLRDLTVVFVFVLLSIAIALGCAWFFENEIYGIAAMGAGVFVLARVFVMGKYPLDKSLVDAIYYTAAIVAVVLTFASNWKERQVSQFREERSIREDKLASLTLRKSAAEKRAEELDTEAEAANQLGEKAIAGLESAELSGFASHEAAIAGELSSILRGVASAMTFETIQRDARSCESILPGLQEQWMMLYVEANAPKISIDPLRDEGLGKLPDLSLYDANAQLLGVAQRISDCEAKVALAASVGPANGTGPSAPDGTSSFEELEARLEIMSGATPSALAAVPTGNLASYPATFETSLRMVRQILDLRGMKATAEKSALRVAKEIETNAAEVATLATSIKATQDDIGKVADQITTIGDSEPQGFAASAIYVLYQYWPFAIILLLGMKLARGPLWSSA